MFLFSYGLTESLKWTFVNILSIKSDLKVTSLWLKKCLICACHASNIYHVHLKTKSPWWSLAVWLAKERFAKFLPFLLLYYRNVFEQKWQNGHFNTSIKNAYFYLKHWFILHTALACPIRYEVFFLPETQQFTAWSWPVWILLEVFFGHFSIICNLIFCVYQDFESQSFQE